MTELTSLGAVIAHALELEQSLQVMARAAGDARRAEASRQRGEELARIRREAISEMILEPLSGIEAISLNGLSLDAATERLAAFYRDAADRMSIPDVARALRRLGERTARIGPR
ncbi:MAG: hypothetical protein RML36_13100 [Anaerolineae bacterium]|nr:hypothetical protein [Anaerolineae bacterium]MDW8100410.1 hypothetical protein [Anaerolineae bacterium]